LLKDQRKLEVAEVALHANPNLGQWDHGNAPSQALLWAVTALAKAGALSIFGVYLEAIHSFPIGMAMLKNLTVRMGNCPHTRLIPELVQMVRSGQVDPHRVLTQREPKISVILA
jgi:threonine dehydrogenase-like Zn-dependent dehydrogenase